MCSPNSPDKGAHDGETMALAETGKDAMIWSIKWLNMTKHEPRSHWKPLIILCNDIRIWHDGTSIVAWHCIYHIPHIYQIQNVYEYNCWQLLCCNQSFELHLYPKMLSHLFLCRAAYQQVTICRRHRESSVNPASSQCWDILEAWTSTSSCKHGCITSAWDPLTSAYLWVHMVDCHGLLGIPMPSSISMGLMYGHKPLKQMINRPSA